MGSDQHHMYEFTSAGTIKQSGLGKITTSECISKYFFGHWKNPYDTNNMSGEEAGRINSDRNLREEYAKKAEEWYNSNKNQYMEPYEKKEAYMLLDSSWKKKKSKKSSKKK